MNNKKKKSSTGFVQATTSTYTQSLGDITRILVNRESSEPKTLQHAPNIKFTSSSRQKERKKQRKHSRPFYIIYT